jgi:hypothetical protein
MAACTMHKLTDIDTRHEPTIGGSKNRWTGKFPLYLMTNHSIGTDTSSLYRHISVFEKTCDSRQLAFNVDDTT